MSIISIDQPKASQHTELLLVAFAPEKELLNYISKDCIDEQLQDVENLRKQYAEAQIKVKEIMEKEKKYPDTIKIRQIPEGYEELLNEYLSHSSLKHSRNDNSSFMMVELDKIVAAQRNVNKFYTTELQRKWSGGISFEELLEICLSPHKTHHDVRHLEIAQDVHSFSSENADFRYLGSYVKNLTEDDLAYNGGGVPVAAVISFVGYGTTPISAYKIGNRVILNNGFHRAYALRSMGIKEIPVLLKNVKDELLEFPRTFFGFPKEYLIKSPRPSVIKDFFEPGFAVELKMKKRLRVVEAKINGNTFEVPC